MLSIRSSLQKIVKPFMAPMNMDFRSMATGTVKWYNSSKVTNTIYRFPKYYK